MRKVSILYVCYTVHTLCLYLYILQLIIEIFAEITQVLSTIFRYQ